jgi:hypothetical protein
LIKIYLDFQEEVKGYLDVLKEILDNIVLGE